GADAPRAEGAGAGDDRRRGRDLRQAPAQPRGDGSVPGLLPEAQARLLEVLSMTSELTLASAEGRPGAAGRAPFRPATQLAKLGLLPLLIAQGRHVRATALKLPEAAGERRGVAGNGRVALRVLI